MPVDEYIRSGRSEILQVASPGEILQAVNALMDRACTPPPDGPRPSGNAAAFF